MQFPTIQIGQPVRYNNLSIFPLFAETSSPVDYRLAEEAIAAEDVVVQEVGEQGSVPELIVENKGQLRILFLEGEHLVGAKQNRILNTSILVAAKSKIKIPVSCVEQGRWRYASPTFAAGEGMAAGALRYALKHSVSKSLRMRSGHVSDQGAIWQEVSRQQRALGAFSHTAAMADTYEAHAGKLADYKDKLKYIEGATGIAVGIGSRALSFDLFDKAETCRKVWETLLSGFVMDALEAQGNQEEVSSGEVEKLLAESRSARWQEANAVGEGLEFRTEFADKQGSALTFDGTVVHVNVVAGR